MLHACKSINLHDRTRPTFLLLILLRRRKYSRQAGLNWFTYYDGKSDDAGSAVGGDGDGADCHKAVYRYQARCKAT
jgi:hypothetical protein